MSLLLPPSAPVLEPTPVEIVYVDGIAAIEAEGGIVRIHLYANEIALEAPDAGPHRILKIKLIGPLSNIPMVIGQLASCLTGAMVEPVRQAAGGGPKLVK